MRREPPSTPLSSSSATTAPSVVRRRSTVSMPAVSIRTYWPSTPANVQRSRSPVARVPVTVRPNASSPRSWIGMGSAPPRRSASIQPLITGCARASGIRKFAFSNRSSAPTAIPTMPPSSAATGEPLPLGFSAASLWRNGSRSTVTRPERMPAVTIGDSAHSTSSSTMVAGYPRMTSGAPSLRSLEAPHWTGVLA